MDFAGIVATEGGDETLVGDTGGAQDGDEFSELFLVDGVAGSVDCASSGCTGLENRTCEGWGLISVVEEVMADLGDVRYVDV